MSSAEQLDRAAGAMLGTFVGDALGMPWEGLGGEAIPEQVEMREGRLGIGTYTDDTEMMIALAESLERCDVVDERDLARTFLSHHDPRRGYGGGTTRVLELLSREVPVDEAARRIFDGRGSLGNGAAMRIAPVAVRFFEDQVVVETQARRSARVTHAHPLGIDAAAVQAAATAAALDRADIAACARRTAKAKELGQALDKALRVTRLGLDPAAVRGAEKGIPASGVASVAAAVAVGARAESFEEAVSVAVRAGGDTDTVAAMAGAIAGARFGASAIPQRWLDVLEDGERGRSHVEALARALTERGPLRC